MNIIIGWDRVKRT